LSHKFFETIPPPATSSIEKEKSMSGLIVAHRHRDNNLFRKKGGRVRGSGKKRLDLFFIEPQTRGVGLAVPV
jgi:hypothetical protein